MAYGPGREPVRRGEAPQREADPDQRPGAARPGALHPVRPLHPVRQGGGRRPADPLHEPGQRHRGQHLPRRAVRLVLQRQHRADLPGGCPDRHRPTASRPARGTSTPPSRPAPSARSAAGSRSTRPATRSCATVGVDVDPVNWGWLCDKGRFGYEAVTADDRLGEPLVRQGDDLVARPLGRGARPVGRRPAAAPRPAVDRRDRRRPPDQRGRLRLGQARQGRARHRQRRRPAR